MSRKPPSAEAALRQEWSTAEDFIRYNAPRHQQQVIKLISGSLTTDGVQYSTWTRATSSGSSKSTMHYSGSTYPVVWAGLEGFYVDELEAGLTLELMGTQAATTLGYRWEVKDDDESTWSALSTWRTVKGGTSTAISRTLSGYGSLATGYNKLPLETRVRFFTKGTRGKFRVKSSSYIAIKAKKQS